MAGYDLHTHTTASDGTTTPERNVELALAAGLDGLGVTDHDTADGWERARAAAEGTSLEVVPGAELSAEHAGLSVHVIGLWFDPADGALAAEMDRLRSERERRAEEIVARFVSHGRPIAIERVREIAASAPIGRPHIAAAVVEAGHARDLQEVFDVWLRDGGPAYVPKYAVDPVRCVELVTGAGGVAVVAHPGLYGDRGGDGSGGLDGDGLEAMAAAGMAGIEADHPDHAPEQRTRYRDLARALGLVVTAGSDFHGDRKDLAIGDAVTPTGALEALRERRPRP